MSGPRHLALRKDADLIDNPLIFELNGYFLCPSVRVGTDFCIKKVKIGKMDCDHSNDQGVPYLYVPSNGTIPGKLRCALKKNDPGSYIPIVRTTYGDSLFILPTWKRDQNGLPSTFAFSPGKYPKFHQASIFKILTRSYKSLPIFFPELFRIVEEMTSRFLASGSWRHPRPTPAPMDRRMMSMLAMFLYGSYLSINRSLILTWKPSVFPTSLHTRQFNARCNLLGKSRNRRLPTLELTTEFKFRGGMQKLSMLILEFLTTMPIFQQTRVRLMKL